MTRRLTMLIAGLAFGLPVLTPAHGAAAGNPCDRIAAPWGSDRNSGRAGNPLRSVDALVNRLRARQTGCLRSGDAYRVRGNELGIDERKATLRSYPGERATVIGLVVIERPAVGAAVKGLRLDGRNPDRIPSPFIAADNAVVQGNKITNRHTGICVMVRGQNGDAYYVDGAVIRDNLIHDCGQQPATNHHHGIYAQRSRRLTIRNNVILDNADRGIQLYYDVHRTRIVGNVIDGNGEGLIISGDHGYVPTRTIVRGNVIANSRIRHNVEEFYPSGHRIGKRNRVTGNCIGNGGPGFKGQGHDSGLQRNPRGFKATGNLLMRPDYRSRWDGTLAPDSACATFLRKRGQGVALRASKRRARAGRHVGLHGSRSGAAGSTVSLIEIRRRNWWRAQRTRVGEGGGFKTRGYVRKRGSRFRAVVHGVGESKTVRIRRRR